jgi:hypothetical protein
VKCYLVALLKSKRTWVIVLTALAHVLVKKHVILSADAINDISDQFVLIVGSLGVIGTKVMDSKQPAQLTAPPKE